MTEIVLSIILLFGLEGGPTADFDTGAVDSSVTASQTIKPAKNSK